MAVVKEFRTAADYWLGMVEPDYREFETNQHDLRAAFHCAISLFHMCDWVWNTHETAVRVAFSISQQADDARWFANALEARCDDFGRVRGIANAAKHLALKPHGVRPVPNAPSHAANTAVQITGGEGGGYGGPGGYGVAMGYASGPRVVLAGTTDTNFMDVAKAVFQMWETLRALHNW